MLTELDVTLDGQAAGTESLRAVGQVIRAAAARSERLVHGRLTLAESEHGLARSEHVDLAGLVGPALDQVAASAGEVGIRTATALQEAPVTGRRVLLERLVENLADNGIRHNRPGGCLAILTASGGNTVTLIVESSGPLITGVRWLRCSSRSGGCAPIAWARPAAAGWACRSSVRSPRLTAATPGPRR
jgi:signal transduction histidine kinase